MPLPVDQIRPDTPLIHVRELISETIRKLIDEENKDPQAAAGQAYGMAQKAWGKAIPKAD